MLRITEPLKKHQKLKFCIALIAIHVGFVGASGARVYAAGSMHVVGHAGGLEHEKGLFVQIGQFWNRVQKAYEQFQHLTELDQEVTALRGRVATLEKEKLMSRYRHEACEVAKESQALRAAAVAEGGVPHARTLASLTKERAVSSDPFEAFEHDDFVGAAHLFWESLYGSQKQSPAHSEGGTVLHSAREYYLAGISFYKIHNYKTALKLFEAAQRAGEQSRHLASPKSKAKSEHVERDEHGGSGEHKVASGALHDLSYAPRAMAWKVLCHQRLGNHALRVKAIEQLIQKYPNSKEARRLNRNA